MNGSNVALDSTDAIQVLNEAGDAEHWLSSFEQVFLPAIIVGELRFGALNSRRVSENLKRVEQLISRCIVLDVDVNTSQLYAEIRLELKRKGTPIPENDLWTAAICRQHDVPLASTDQHFEHVPGLQLIKR